jgi:hypothetical protein
MAARPGGLNELRGELLHPAVDRDMVNSDAALGHQFLDVPVGQAVAQVPADCERDHLRREPEASKDRGRGVQSPDQSPAIAIDQRNSAIRSPGQQ